MQAEDINPATSMRAGSFRRNCPDGRHFNYQSWRKEYLCHRGKLGATRQRNEIINEMLLSSCSVQLLETNVWAYEAPRPSGVPQEWRTVEPLIELLNAAQPRVVVFHGRAIAKARRSSAWEQLVNRLGLPNYPRTVDEQVECGWHEVQAGWGTVFVRVSRHLSLVTHEQARQLAEQMCERTLPTVRT